MKKKLAFFDLVVIALLILFCIIFIYPLWTIFVATFSSPLDYVKNPLAMWPENFTVYNFGKLLTSQNVWTGYKNTLIYTGLGTLIDVSMTFVMAYALSLKELPWRRPISFLITLTLFFSGGMIPTYLIIKAYGMLNSIWAMVLPGAIATYNLMITRTYLSQQIPGELVEAAEVDGAGALRTFLQIVTPLAKPILAVITLFYAADHWNGYKDNADTIIGNMDTSIFLGGKEPTTLKELAAVLGKETIDTYNVGESRGRETSHSLNYQKLGKELMSQDELAVMDGSKCILQLRGVRPFLSDKYDITQHPNYKLTADADPKNAFDIEGYLKARLKLKPNQVCDVYEIDAAANE